MKYFHVFGSTCCILADREYYRKWDVKSEQGIFLGYSQNSRAYRVFNNRFGIVMEITNVEINDLEPTAKRTIDEDDEAPNVPVVSSTVPTEAPKVDIQADSADKNSKSSCKDVTANNTELIPSAHVRNDDLSSSIIGNPSVEITTRKKEKVDCSKTITDLCYTSTIEPSTVDIALKDEYWINAMQEELLQFKCNNVWTLVSKPEGANIKIQIGFLEIRLMKLGM